MSTVEQEPTRDVDPPFVRYEEINVEKCPAGWHFDNFDRLRERADMHFGDAAGHEFWLPSRMEEIRSVFQDPAIFSSSAIAPQHPDPQYKLIPEMLDPPLHTKWRRLLGGLFAPGAVERLESRVRELFNDILDDVADRGECDFVQDVALRFPNTIFMELMGLPVSEAARFQDWETKILHSGGNDAYGGEGQQAMIEVASYFSELIAARRKEPRNDILSAAITWEIDDVPVSDADLLSLCVLMFMAGLDTVASQLSYSFLHLATHDDHRRAIVEQPALIPSAIEEFLRYYAFVTPGRKVLQDTELGGCPVKAGQMVYLPLSSANRDPSEFADAEKVILDREKNRHIAFGSGPHRCLGSHLARQELRIALEEWHRRIPEYRLAPGTTATEHGGQIGPDVVPLVWDVVR